VLEIISGRVTRHWHLDLHGVPDLTREELRVSLGSFLFNVDPGP
jgi:hypothetical protein